MALAVDFRPVFCGPCCHIASKWEGEDVVALSLFFYGPDGELCSRLFYTLMATVLPGDHSLEATVRSAQLRRR